MNKKIITVSREFGSGGRTIAKQMAERLGFAYYDNELVTKIAKESGFAEAFVRESGEDASSTSSFLFNLAMNAGILSTGGHSIYDQLYTVQRNIIKELGEKGSCVIVGRCADYILRDRDDCLHTFFHADIPFRAERIVRLYGETDAHPEKRLKEKDNKRRTYYNHYTNRQWGMAQNYHLSLNSGVIGIDRCLDIVVGLVLIVNQLQNRYM